MPAAAPPPGDGSPPIGAEFRGAVPRRDRRAPAAVALASLAVLVVALLTRTGGAPDPSGPVSVTAVTPVAASESPSGPMPPPLVTPRPPSAIVVPPGRDPDATPWPTLPVVPAAEGPVTIRPFGATRVSGMTIGLPTGWERAGDGMVVKSGGGHPVGASLGVWSVAAIETFPCRWTSPVVADPALMLTAEGQAVALSSWWGQDPGKPPASNVAITPVSTIPVPTTLAGRPAWYLEMLVLSAFDVSECDGGQLVLWETATGEVRVGGGPGELHRLWVVDVGGEVIVIDAASYRETSPADLAELEALVASIAFVP